MGVKRNHHVAAGREREEDREEKLPRDSLRRSLLTPRQQGMGGWAAARVKPGQPHLAKPMASEPLVLSSVLQIHGSPCVFFPVPECSQAVCVAAA